jgi:hypothetical protein
VHREKANLERSTPEFLHSAFANPLRWLYKWSKAVLTVACRNEPLLDVSPGKRHAILTGEISHSVH